jgi:Alcohol acetyltransferase
VADSLLINGIETLTFGAIRRMVEMHPVLGLSIADEGSVKPSWTRLPKIDLREVVQFVKLDKQATESYCGIIETTHDKPFGDDGERPLWRIVVIEHRGSSSNETSTRVHTIDVAFFVHHGISDGMSGIAFHLGFLDALNRPAIEKDIPQLADPIVVPPRLVLLPPIEAHPLPLSLFFIASTVFKSLLSSSADKLLWTGPPIRAENNTTHLRTLFIPAPIVDSLLRLTRENGVTLTSLLSVVIARLLATTYPEYQRFSSTTAMSFRRFTGMDKRAMVLYVSSFRHRFSSVRKVGYIDCGGTFSWDAVRACKLEIDAATASPKNQTVGLLKFLDDYASYLRKKVGSKREYSFEVSNVGVMDGGLDDHAKDVRVKRILFSQSSNVTGGACVFSVASVKGGDLAVGLTWQDGMVEAELASKVLLGLETELQSLVNT